MTKIDPVLTAVVVYSLNDKGQPITRISIRVGGVEVANKTVGRRWTQEQAMKEWRINRRTFKMVEGAETFLQLAV